MFRGRQGFRTQRGVFYMNTFLTNSHLARAHSPLGLGFISPIHCAAVLANAGICEQATGSTALSASHTALGVCSTEAMLANMQLSMAVSLLRSIFEALVARSLVTFLKLGEEVRTSMWHCIGPRVIRPTSIA